jgi:hypothetical protein
MSENFQGIKFCRICELNIGDEFLYMGLWRKAVRIEERVVYYKTRENLRGSVSANKQFVEVIRSGKVIKPSAT